MKNLFLLIILLTALQLSSQNYITDFQFLKKNYTINSEKQEADYYKITIIDSNENKTDFTLKPLKGETFDLVFFKKSSYSYFRNIKEHYQQLHLIH